MGFLFPKGPPGLVKGEGFVPDRRLWLTEDRAHVVDDGDPRARFLFAVPGRTIDLGEAIRYGLTKERKPLTKVIMPKETKSKR